GQAAPAPHPGAGAGAEREERPVRPCGIAATGTGGRFMGKLVAARARWPRRLPLLAGGLAPAGPCVGDAGSGGSLAALATAEHKEILMDEIVKAAMAKWPNVPDCFGWLGLDQRGTWHMRDDRIQAQGPFAPLPGETGVGAKGSALRHDKLIEFIHRNYLADE